MSDIIDSFILIEEQAINAIAGCIQNRMHLHRLVNQNPIEDHITCDLIGYLSNEPDHKDIFGKYNCCVEKYVLIEDKNDGLYKYVGRMDIVINIEVKSDIKKERKIYGIVFEAKKLNCPKSNTDQYVENGVHRFVTNKYASGEHMGCMLGYVMNGNLNGLKTDIVNKMKNSNKKYDVKLKNGPIPLLPKINNTERFETTHEREGQNGDIVIRHTLLKCK